MSFENLPEGMLRVAVLERVPKLTGMYPRVGPDNARYPFATYNRVGGPALMSHGGSDGVVQARIQISVFAETYRETVELSEDIRQKLAGYRSPFIQGVLPQEPVDLRDPDAGVYYRARDFIIWAVDAPVGG